MKIIYTIGLLFFLMQIMNGQQTETAKQLQLRKNSKDFAPVRIDNAQKLLIQNRHALMLRKMQAASAHKKLASQVNRKMMRKRNAVIRKRVLQQRIIRHRMMNQPINQRRRRPVQ